MKVPNKFSLTKNKERKRPYHFYDDGKYISNGIFLLDVEYVDIEQRASNNALIDAGNARAGQPNISLILEGLQSGYETVNPSMIRIREVNPETKSLEKVILKAMDIVVFVNAEYFDWLNDIVGIEWQAKDYQSPVKGLFDGKIIALLMPMRTPVDFLGELQEVQTNCKF